MSPISEDMLKCFEDTFRERLNNFRIHGMYCDLAIQVEDQTFLCHKSILASSCMYFDGLLRGDFQESKLDKINLPIMGAKIFENILRFIYTRHIEINNENVIDLLMAGDFLGIDYILERCFDFVEAKHNTLTIDSTFAVFQFAVDNKRSFLVNVLSLRLYKTIAMSSQSSLFREISPAALHFILQWSSEFESDADGIVNTIIHWMDSKLEDEKCTVPKVIKMLDFEDTNWPYSKVMMKYAVDCNEDNVMISNAYKLNCVSNGEDQFPSNENVLTSSSLKVYFYCDSGSKQECISYMGVVSLNDKLEWKCYQKMSTIRYSNGESGLLPPDQEIKFTHLTSKRTVCGENLFHVMFDNNPANQERIKFVCSNRTNINSEIILKNPPPAIDIIYKASLCAVQKLVYLQRQGINNRSVLVYRSELDEWVSVLPPTAELMYSELVNCNDILYSVDGNSMSQGSRISRFDSRLPNWQILPSMSHKNVSVPTACVLDEKIYVCDALRPHNRNSTTVQVFDPVADRWQMIAPRKKNVRHVNLASYNDRIWAIGTGETPGEALSIEAYDPKSNEWHSFNSPDEVIPSIGDTLHTYGILDCINIKFTG